MSESRQGKVEDNVESVADSVVDETQEDRGDQSYNDNIELIDVATNGENDESAIAEAEGFRGLPDIGLKKALEAILIVVDEPVGDVELAQVLEAPREAVSAALEELAAEYLEQDR